MTTSVILCTYNGEKYIDSLLESLIKQTRAIDEILVSDDGSDDSTIDIIDKYKNDNANIILVSNADLQGAAGNFIHTALKASGDLLFFCDQDDIWMSDKIEKMSEIMEKDLDIDVLASNLRPVYTGKKRIKDRFALEKQKCDDKVEKVSIKAGNFNIKRSGCTMCIRKSYLDRIAKYWLNGWYHDDFVWKCSVLEGKLAIYRHLTVLRRIHESNASIAVSRTRKNRLNNITDEIRFIEQACEAGNIHDADIKYEIKKFISFQKNRYQAISRKNFFKYAGIILNNSRLYRSRAQMILDGYFALPFIRR